MTDGLPLIERRWAMVTIALAIAMSTLDSTIANVALPTIARDLNTTPNNSIWVINAYQLTLSICLLPFSSIGDIVGYRKIYCAGLAIFTAASLACAISSSLPALTLARVIQGVGAAGILSVNSAIIRRIYPKKEFGRGMGFNAFIVAIFSALGPTIASGILAIGTWEWLFALNVPIGLLALYIAMKHIPDYHNGSQFDWPNAVLCAMTISILIISIDGIGHHGKVIQVITGIFFAIFMGSILIYRELKVDEPLFPVDLFKIPLFSSSIATSICSYISQMAAFTSLPFFMQYVLLRTEVETGLLLTPWPIATALTAILAGRMADKYPVGILCGIGLAVFATGLTLMAELSTNATDITIMWRMAMCGIGFGLFQTPNNRAILDSTPLNRSSAAGGMMSSARLLGQTIGAALVSLSFVIIPIEPTRTVLYCAGLLSLIAAGVSLIRQGEKFRTQF